MTGGFCKAGTFCPQGSTAPVPCTPGYYCQTDKLPSVSGECLPGYYCSGSAILPNPVNDTTGDVCPKGHYCPSASPYPLPCGEGEFSDRYGNHNASNCLPCTAGMYCSGTGRDLPNGYCDEGWFCPSGMTVPQPPGNRCLAGHSCPLGSPQQTPCASGSYQPLPEQGICLVCPAGLYCDQTEAVTELQSGVSAPSHGVVTPKDCPAGFYCPNGTRTDRENPCPVGTFSNNTGLESLSECRTCTPGHFCESENITSPTGQCQPGYYCVMGVASPAPTASANGGPCPQGTYCVKGSITPTPCPKGTFGDRARLPALGDCTICPPGEYCEMSGLTNTSGLCLPGYYCTNGSEEAAPVGKGYGDECPVGHYCPTGSHQPVACLSGFYQPNIRMTNVTACLPCDPGMFCNSTGAETVSGSCYEGFYCTGGATSPAPYDGVTGDICPAGSYCPEGSPQHFFCPNSTYTNHTGSSQCYDCPEGYYCVNRDRADPCLPGHYCPAKTGADLQLCPTGTYNPIYRLYDVSQCIQCDGGKYCQTAGLDQVTGNCSAGYYCQSGEIILSLIFRA